MRRLLMVLAVAAAASASARAQESKYYELTKGDYPHDVAVGPGGKPPGERPRTYAVWVDPDDKVWLAEWAANAIARFDPATERFGSFPGNRKNADVRQLLRRKGETWIAESGTGRSRVIMHAGVHCFYLQVSATRDLNVISIFHAL